MVLCHFGFFLAVLGYLLPQVPSIGITDTIIRGFGNPYFSYRWIFWPFCQFYDEIWYFLRFFAILVSFRLFLAIFCLKSRRLELQTQWSEDTETHRFHTGTKKCGTQIFSFWKEKCSSVWRYLLSDKTYLYNTTRSHCLYRFLDGNFCQNGTFEPVHKIQIFGQKQSFEALWKWE